MVSFAVFWLNHTKSQFSIDRLTRLHGPIEQEIRGITEYLKSLSYDDEGTFDALIQDEGEQIEELLGIAFATTQTYLTSVRTSLAEVSQLIMKETGLPLSVVKDNKAYSVFAIGSSFSGSHTFVQIVNAIANYSKHHEEWPTHLVQTGGVLEYYWDTSKLKNNATIEIVSSIGMRPSNAWNLRDSASLLGISEFYDLAPLRVNLEAWAQQLLEKVEEELQKLNTDIAAGPND